MFDASLTPILRWQTIYGRQLSPKKEHIIQFLRSKGWIVEELDNVEDDIPHKKTTTEAQPAESTGPPSRIIFDSSSDTSETTVALQKVQENDDDDDYEDDENPETASVKRSAYIGRSNVQAFRAARKNAGLSDMFPASDPLLIEFGKFLRTARAAEKDIRPDIKDTEVSQHTADCNIGQASDCRCQTSSEYIGHHILFR